MKYNLYKDIRAPEGMLINHTQIELTAINSVAIITEKSWQDTVRCLIEQAHIRCNLPSYKTCITDMFRANGFKPMRDTFTSESIGNLNDDFLSGKQYIAKICGVGYFALVPDKTQGVYSFRGYKQTGSTFDFGRLEELWLYIPETDNRTGITRYSNAKNQANYIDSLEYQNENPQNRSTGDCAIRAIATLLECSWHDALDLLAEAAEYNDYEINKATYIQKVLDKHGFFQYPELRVCGKYISGKLACSLFNSVLSNGERILAYLGEEHCAAIMPDESGNYKIYDSWDSTKLEVTKYFVLHNPEKKKKQKPQSVPKNEPKPEPVPEPKLKPEFEIFRTLYPIGAIINHPIYGKGTVKSHIVRETGLTLEIRFDSGEYGHISSAWLQKNALS